MKQAWLAVLIALSSLGAAQATDLHEAARVHTQLAGAYYARGQYGVALEEIKAAREDYSDYAPSYSVEGLIYMDLREFDKADQAFLHALRLTPEDPDANHNYGFFLCNRREKYTESLHYFIAAIKNPLYSTPQKSLQMAGLCALKAGDVTAAEDYLRQADRIEPDSLPTTLGLAKLALRRGEPATAQTLLRRPSVKNAASAEAVWLSLQAEHRLGHADVVTGLGRELQNRFPDSDEARRYTKGQLD